MTILLALPNISLAATYIRVDGSSTVYPITEAVAEEFGKENKDIRVTVGISGTGGGFKKFCRGETDVSDASRPIKASEVALCKENAIEYIEIPVAYDGLSVLVNPSNTWADSLTVSELKAIWEPAAQGVIMRWNQIRPEWPNEEIALFGPGTDSGTYDYFTESINGKAGASRGDFTSSEDDNILVQGIAGNKYSLGYFGLAYYEENADKLKLVAVDNEKGQGGILPTMETVNNGSYAPLSRPIFIYVSTAALKKPEVKSFVDFYIANSAQLSEEVGYIPLPDDIITHAARRFKQEKTGSVFTTSAAKSGLSFTELMARN
ncbi:MAG TPA: PstS family phosphate ABC transporter substrate-binding protein [Candidatus Omnitrophota bacterium]|nr:PstS family phosphate ABC transporter substrate-binding protein [Candidatus Omnitrophota bacterium]